MSPQQGEVERRRTIGERKGSTKGLSRYLGLSQRYATLGLSQVSMRLNILSTVLNKTLALSIPDNFLANAIINVMTCISAD